MKFFAVLFIAGVASKYTWPSDTDSLESLFYQQDGLFRHGFMDGVKPCSFGFHRPGILNSAEWIRTAYHDMITYNAATQTGGLDASIVFETNRKENIGTAFENTFGFATGFYNSRTSMSDLIALMTFTAVRACGGLSIPFRSGRIDATEAGPYGVPEPQEHQSALIVKFKNAGFDVPDMIKMVACGHTLGGVHSVNFPQITEVEHDKFDKTDQFDNVVVTSYLADNTTNPLVKGPKATNSDTKVFSADRNVTMKAIADPKAFQNSCRDILERMINTVPRGVKLSEPFQPIPVKPVNVKLSLAADGTLSLAGAIRVLETGRKNTNMTVKLVYKTRNGERCVNSTIATVKPNWRDGKGFGFDHVFSFYEFTATLGPAGISSFDVSISTSDGEEIHENGGGGFPVQSDILLYTPQSCLRQQPIGDGKWNLTVTAAVHSSQEPSDISLLVSERVPRPGTVVPKLVPRKTSLVKWQGRVGKSQYSLYRATFALPIVSWSTTFDVLSERRGNVVGDYFQSTGGLPGVCGS